MKIHKPHIWPKELHLLNTKVETLVQGNMNRALNLPERKFKLEDGRELSLDEYLKWLDDELVKLKEKPDEGFTEEELKLINKMSEEEIESLLRLYVNLKRKV